MGALSNFLSLILPDREEKYDVSIVNANMNLIDAAIENIDERDRLQDVEITNAIAKSKNYTDNLEIISDEEPENQTVGGYWMINYS